MFVLTHAFFLTLDITIKLLQFTFGIPTTHLFKYRNRFLLNLPSDPRVCLDFRSSDSLLRISCQELLDKVLSLRADLLPNRVLKTVIALLDHFK